MTDKDKIDNTPVVLIKNRSNRLYNARTELTKLRQLAIYKIHQMAGIKKLSKSELYDLAEEQNLNRYLYKNKVLDLENFLEHLISLK